MRGVPVAGIFGLIIAVIIATNITVPKNGKSTYSLFSGYAHLGSGLTVGLSNLATGLAMGMAGEIGVQDSARQPKLYIGMVLIWSFGSALGASPLPPPWHPTALPLAWERMVACTPPYPSQVLTQPRPRYRPVRSQSAPPLPLPHAAIGRHFVCMQS
jgi:F0F1-type ATP synthase membrane subunit c/vacuolar-type H+-ATPase subunit K